MRYPLEPLLDALGQPPLKTASRRLHTHPRQMYRWREYGIDEYQADRLAVTAGLHPGLVWRDWFARA